ncbi:hypothetical protein MHU86_3032 [Fragilaria crotonensis]|nr:hypothetical protein MHU86_3032 [Fragilaria crotonensis]
MNSANRSCTIPKEIEFNNCLGNVFALNTTGDDTSRVGSTGSSRRSRRRDPTNKQSSAHLCTPPPMSLKQVRRRESLRSVSSTACTAAQKFLETTRMEILLEYSTDESCDSRSRVRDENELSLSALAGLLAEKLDDAVERGLFSFDDSPSLSSNKKMHKDMNHQSIPL